MLRRLRKIRILNLLITLVFLLFFSNFVTGLTQVKGSYLEDNLVSYYQLNATSGAVIDERNFANGTNIGGTRGATGKINNAFDYDGANGNQTNFTTTYGLGANTVTLNFWVYIDNTNQGGAFIKIGSGNSGYGVGVGSTIFDNTGNDLIVLFEGVRWMDTNYVLGTGWKMITFRIYPDGTPNLWVNNTEVGNYSGTGAIAPSGLSSIGGYYVSNLYRNSDGSVDEVAILNITLNTTGISDFWNNGNGLQWEAPPVDTCTCAGAGNDWEIAMSDYCNITTACDLTTGTLSFTGAGWCNCNASVDTTNLGDPGASGVLYIQDSCLITID